MGISSISSASAATGVWSTQGAGQGCGDNADAIGGARNAGKDSYKSDFASLLQAIQKGDIGSAQSALTAVQGDLSGSQGYSATSTSSSSSPASPLSTDLKAVIDAVKSGDISSAQSALSTFQTDVQSAVAAKNDASSSPDAPKDGAVHGHHHHHHHGGGKGGGLEALLASALGTTPTDPSSTTPAAPTSPGPVSA